MLKQGSTTRRTPCNVYQTLTAKSSVYVEFAGSRQSDFLDAGSVDVSLTKSRLSFQGFASGIEVTLQFDEGRRSLKQSIFPNSEPLYMGQSSDLKKVEFAVLNGSELSRSKVLILDAEGWEVNIQPVSNQHRLLEDSIESDGARLTHSGILKRIDGKRFHSDQARELCFALAEFLSFAAGWWVGIGFVRGHNRRGRVAWQQWGFTRLQDKRPTFSWHDWRLDGMLTKLFPGFMRLLHQPKWKEPLETVLYWYNRSNGIGAGVDGSIIIIQAAFELLAWQVLVQHSKVLSEDNFHALKAEGQIRVLLGHLGIPLAIPAGLVKISTVAKEFNWSCGPEVLVAIRNQIVHPAKKRKAHREYPYFESWLLGQHLLELCILRLCQYDGDYIDRTDQQQLFPQSRPVPWLS